MLSVGQKLCFVGTHRYNKGPTEVTVTKIGRKWAYLDNGEKIDSVTLWADGGQYGSPGRCWLSEHDWMQEQERCRLWLELHKRLSFRPPDGVSIDTIRQASAMLTNDG